MRSIPPERTAETGREDWSRVATIYESLHPSLLRFAVFLLGDVAAAEDVCQEAFASSMARLEAVEQPGAYLRAVIVNAARQRHRRGERYRGSMQRLGRLRVVEPVSPLDVVAANDVLIQALRKLSRAQREVVVLVYHLDLSLEGAAAVLEVPVGTAKSHLSRALSKLRKEARTWT